MMPPLEFLIAKVKCKMNAKGQNLKALFFEIWILLTFELWH